MSEKRKPHVFHVEISEHREMGKIGEAVQGDDMRGFLAKKVSHSLRFRERYGLEVRRRRLNRALRSKNDIDVICGVPDDKLDGMLKGAVNLRIKESEIAGKPIARYDREKRRAYMQYPDGTRNYDY